MQFILSIFTALAAFINQITQTDIVKSVINLFCNS